MTEEILAKPEGTENGNSTSSPEEQTETEVTQSPEGDNTQGGDNTPFHEHPRWKEREDSWSKRFNDQETRHQEDMRKIREDFSEARKANVEQPIPKWFGGTQEQWNEFLEFEDDRLLKAQDKAIARISEGKSEEDRRVTEATDFMKSEMSFIETDRSINPKGQKVDPEKLLRVVMENDLIDSQGRWNYRAGFKLMLTNTVAPVQKPVQDRKQVAAATTSESKGEEKPSSIKTSQDFKLKKPW